LAFGVHFRVIVEEHTYNFELAVERPQVQRRPKILLPWVYVRIMFEQ
jgi:hypothetical protein